MSRALMASGMPAEVADDECLTRFLVSSGQFNTTQVKPAAFIPNPKNGETSVFRHDGEPKAELWSLAKDAAIDRTVHGVAVVKTYVVRDAGLAVTACEPPPRHANIHQWPTDPDPVMAKAKQKDIAISIAVKARLVLKNKAGDA